MDGPRFDKLTRALAADEISRRTALKRLIGSGAGALVGLAGLRHAAAQTCRGAGSLCTKNGNCCSGICDTTNAAPSKRNRCACPPGQENCRGACKAPTTAYLSDVKNCGGCGQACPGVANGTATCGAGDCGFVCDTAGGAAPCGPTCCAAGQICTNAATGSCCAPNCAGRTCGDDGCGGSCGSCSTGFVCSTDTGTCKNINPSPACAGFSYCGTYGACADGAGSCLATIEGGGFCAPNNVPFFFSIPCTSSADCPIGDLCMDVGCTAVPPAPGYRCTSGQLLP